ncbi:MAG: DUF4440 domain-containing protein [Planctomycetota bacterium]
MRRANAPRRGGPVLGRLGLLALMLGCATPAVPIASPAEDLAGIAQLRHRIEQANNEQDLEKITQCYAVDAIWMPAEGPPVAGRDAIVTRYEESYRRLDLEVDILPDETVASEGWGFERGTTQVRAIPHGSDQTLTKRDKYLMIVRRQLTGEWRIWRLMWSPLTATE